MAKPEQKPVGAKMHFPSQFCVYRQTWRNMESSIFYGKTESAFKPRYGKFIEFEPFDVEIMAFAETMAEAGEIARAMGTPKLDPILCHENLQVYANPAEAAKDLKMHVSGIRNHLRGEPGFDRPKGYTFQRVPPELYVG